MILQIFQALGIILFVCILTVSIEILIEKAVNKYCLNNYRKMIQEQKDKLKEEKDKLEQDRDKILKEFYQARDDKEALDEKIYSLTNDIAISTQSLNELNKTIDSKHQYLETLHNNIDFQMKLENDLEDSCRKAFQSFCETLEQDYDKKDKEYDDKIAQCESAYITKKMQLLAEQKKEQEELDRLKNIRKAIQEAQLREEELKEKENFYRIQIPETEKSDILLFEEFKNKVKNKRAVSMLIWSTWYQKPMTTLCNKILGTNVVCGIYKITNIKTGQVYIGQAVDVASRFKQHAKCGLGIDTPPGNKLYTAMNKDGLSNFTWELLEKCKKEELNERERYYIEVYMSKDYGYNSNIGVKRNECS